MVSRGTRIGRAYSRGHNKLREIFLAGVCLKIYNGDQQNYGNPTATYDDNWYLDKREYTEMVSGKKFKRLVIDDVDGCRLSKLKEMTAVQIGGIVFKFLAKDSFIGSVPSYEFKVYPIEVL